MKIANRQTFLYKETTLNWVVLGTITVQDGFREELSALIIWEL